MFDTLFGEGQYGLKMLVAFIVVFGLLALALWLVRRFGGQRLGSPAGRGRQPRLAVIDSATIDARRRLVLIRRDNVEHLLVIGGPSDVVVEQNIVRVAAAPREAPSARPPAAAEPPPRPVPLSEAGMGPLQPDPGPRLEPTPRPEPAPRPQRPAPVIDESMHWPQPEETAAPAPARERRGRAPDPLAGLADEVARAPADAEQTVRPIELAPRQAARRPPRPQSAPPGPVAHSAAESELHSAADQNLAEMAHRLEAALRRPAKGDDGHSAAPVTVPAPAAEGESAPSVSGSGRGAPTIEVRPARADGRAGRSEAKPAQPKSLYENLEQEMASLLGRPSKH
jgi:flagellar biogenesis protein FliO